MRFFKINMFIYKLWLRGVKNYIKYCSEEILIYNKEIFLLC